MQKCTPPLRLECQNLVGYQVLHKIEHKKPLNNKPECTQVRKKDLWLQCTQLKKHEINNFGAVFRALEFIVRWLLQKKDEKRPRKWFWIVEFWSIKKLLKYWPVKCYFFQLSFRWGKVWQVSGFVGIGSMEWEKDVGD